MAKFYPEQLNERPHTGLLAPEGFSGPLLASIAKPPAASFGDLHLYAGDQVRSPWAQNTWYNVRSTQITSITDAVQKLTAVQRNWWPYVPSLHRRMGLINEKMPHVSAKAIIFPERPTITPLGSYSLIAPDTMLHSSSCSSFFPNGVVRLVEDHVNPPSRAYMKLWEVFSLIDARPIPGQICIDLGASPGGWTWALSKLGAHIHAVDRTPLRVDLMNHPNIKYIEGSAFAMQPQVAPEVDWFFSDVICYPMRLFELVRRWLDAGRNCNFVCTLKFQGREQYQAIEKFQSIAGSSLIHLSCNKHELTWIYIQK